MTAEVEVYTEKRLLRKRKQYRWRVVAKNGQIMATGAEGYYNLADLWHAVQEVQIALGVALKGPIPIKEGK